MSRIAVGFQDHFSPLAASYASFRPRYPSALFDYLARCCPRREAAWDCACGSGQATFELAQRFAVVLATDASAAQLAAAPPHPKVQYRVAPAEASGLAAASVNLVTVAQALHWFELAAFYAEVRRVLRPRGVLAAWTYGVLHALDERIDRRLQEFYGDTLKADWPAERQLVETGYRTLAFPFVKMAPPAFAMHEDWSLPRLLGYIRTWSASARHLERTGVDPVAALAGQLAPLWGDPADLRRIGWPLSLQIGAQA